MGKKFKLNNFWSKKFRGKYKIVTGGNAKYTKNSQKLGKGMFLKSIFCPIPKFLDKNVLPPK